MAAEVNCNAGGAWEAEGVATSASAGGALQGIGGGALQCIGGAFKDVGASEAGGGCGGGGAGRPGAPGAIASGCAPPSLVTGLGAERGGSRHSYFPSAFRTA